MARAQIHVELGILHAARSGNFEARDAPSEHHRTRRRLSCTEANRPRISGVGLQFA